MCLLLSALFIVIEYFTFLKHRDMRLSLLPVLTRHGLKSFYTIMENCEEHRNAHTQLAKRKLSSSRKKRRRALRNRPTELYRRLHRDRPFRNWATELRLNLPERNRSPPRNSYAFFRPDERPTAFARYRGGRNRRFGFANDFNAIAIRRRAATPTCSVAERGFPFYGVAAEF